MDDEISQKIEKLVALKAEMKSSSGKSVAALQQFEHLLEEILHHLVRHPGALVHFDDSVLARDAAILIEEDEWRHWANQEIADRVNENPDLMGELTGVYIERISRIKPIFISVRPNPEVVSFLDQAMRAWAHGLDCAALILCWSVLEDLLKGALARKDWKLHINLEKGKTHVKWAKELIKTAAKAEVFDDDLSQKAEHILNMRNDAVHRLNVPSEGETHAAILATKVLIERLLSCE